MKRFLTLRTVYWLPAGLIFLASAVRLFVCLQHNPMDYMFSDAATHWMEGTHFPKGGYGGAANPILYQLYIFVLHKLTADNKVVIGLISGLLSVAMPWTYYRAARTFGMRKNAALWVWVFIACTPSSIALYHYFMMETLLLPLQGTALWMTARYLRKGGREPFLTAVVVWTAACLAKPTVFPLAAMCLLWAGWKQSPSLRDIALATGLVAVLLVPQTLRTEIALGFAAPLGNPWLIKIQHRSGVKTLYVNFYTHQNRFVHVQAQPLYQMFFNSPSTSVQPLLPLSDWSLRRAHGDSHLTISIDSAYGVRDWKRAYASLHVSREEWLSQWGENIVLFLFAPSFPESAEAGWDGRLEYQARWMWAPLIALVLILNVRQFVKRRFDLIPVAVTLFALFLGLQNSATFEGRYRKPLEPLLLLNLVWIGPKRSDETTLSTEMQHAVSPASATTK
jgi:hypothetical protein